MDPLIAVIAFGVLGGIYGAVYAFSRRILKRYGHVRAAANSERFRICNEALGGIKDIKLLGREGSYAARYANPSRRMARALVGVQVFRNCRNSRCRQWRSAASSCSALS